MRLRSTDWSPVFNASGARGFSGEGYWYHPWLKPFGLNYRGSTFVSKTTTLNSRVGNMPLDEQFRPIEHSPKCIVVDLRKGIVLNSVGLSGPGADALIDRWIAEETRPKDIQWMASYMSVAPKAEERLQEASLFFEKMQRLVEAHGRLNMGLQINFSCPNVGLNVSEEAHLIGEVIMTLDAAMNLSIPTLIKLNALVSPLTAKTMMDHPSCDGLVISNTIPWGKMPEAIDWEGLFGTNISPLAHLGGGGLSGAPLKRIVGDWIKTARLHGVAKPIIAGGGILSVEDAEFMLDCGADGVELGSVSILRPWRVRNIIDYVTTRLA